MVPSSRARSSGPTAPRGRSALIGVQCDNDTGFCKYWEGLVYELRDGRIELVSGEDAEPPEQILFTDLGASLFYSNLTIVLRHAVRPQRRL